MASRTIDGRPILDDIVDRLKAAHDDGVFWPGDICPRMWPHGRRCMSETVKRHLKTAGLAEPGALRDGHWRLTEAGRERLGLTPIKPAAE